MRSPAASSGCTLLMIASLLRGNRVFENVDAARSFRALKPDVRFVLLGLADSANPSAIGIDQVRAWEDEVVIRYLVPARRHAPRDCRLDLRLAAFVLRRHSALPARGRVDGAARRRSRRPQLPRCHSSRFDRSAVRRARCERPRGAPPVDNRDGRHPPSIDGRTRTLVHAATVRRMPFHRRVSRCPGPPAAASWSARGREGPRARRSCRDQPSVVGPASDTP